MRSTAFSPCHNLNWVLPALVTALILAGGCNPFRPAFRPTIFSGEHLSHRLRFPDGFELPRNVDHGVVRSLGHFRFRTRANAPGTLVVSACGYVIPDMSQVETNKREAWSPDRYLIDTTHGYFVSRATTADWDSASGIPCSRRFGEGGTKPCPDLFFVSEVTNPAEGRFRFRSIDYGNPEKWFINPGLHHTVDNRLAFLIGIDERRLPSGPVYIGDRIGGGAYGNYMLDFFAASTGRKLASMRMDCGMATANCFTYVTVANSRWVVFAVAADLTEALLFNFDPELPLEKK